MITWLASYPKSGNTWIRLLLNAFLHETNDLTKLVTANNDNHRYYYDAVSPDPDISKTNMLLLRSAALYHMVKNKTDFLKTHHANAQIQGIPLIPRPLTDKAVYIVRDPRDVVLSVARHFGDSIDNSIEALNDNRRAIDGDGNFHFLGSWSFHVDSWSNTEFPTHMIKYENLISDTYSELENLLRFLDIDPDPQRIEMAIELTQFDKLQEQEERTGFAEKSSFQDVFFKHQGSRWKNILTDAQRDKIESTHSETMIRLGYT